MDLSGYRLEIAKITDTMLGTEDRGVLTGLLRVDYGGTSQGVGGYNLAVRNAAGVFITGVLRACAVDSWEKVKGRTIFVVFAKDDKYHPLGIAPLPTEPGSPFMFTEMGEREA
jgi:hypothetical protein